MKESKDKVAVITGAASGIGRGIAERCVREGRKVVLADIDKANLTKAETELETTSGATVLGVKTDVSKRSDVELLAQKALDAFGRVHLLFNNAGVGAGGRHGRQPGTIGSGSSALICGGDPRWRGIPSAISSISCVGEQGNVRLL
jgi:NAD(P)-dependent dehydrogenase (short-subunit alcohol dehydrogenase family)